MTLGHGFHFILWLRHNSFLLTHECVCAPHVYGVCGSQKIVWNSLRARVTGGL